MTTAQAPQPRVRAAATRPPQTRTTAARPTPARPSPVPWEWVGLGALVIAGWVALAATGGATLPIGEGVGGVSGVGDGITFSAGGAAAAAGAAVLAAAVTRRRGRDLASFLFGLLLLPVALALAASGGDARPLLAAIAVEVGLAVSAGARSRSGRLRAAALAGLGTTLVASVVLAQPGAGSVLAPAATIYGATLVAGAALLVLAGAGGSIGVPALKPLLAVGLVAGLLGAAATDGPLVAVLIGAVALGVATVRPAAAVALFAIALASLPGGLPAAALVGSGALIAQSLDRDWAVIAALPGGIAMVEVLLIPGPVLPRAIVGLTALLIDVAIVRSLISTQTKPDEGTRLVRPVDLARLPGVGQRTAERHRLPALVLGLWLLVAPGSWTWAGDTRLHDYDVGAGRSIATGLLLMTGLAVADHVLARRRATVSP